MKNALSEPAEWKTPSTLLIMLALILAFLPSAIVFVMFAFFKGRDVPAWVLFGEYLFSLACCSAPSLLLLRRHPIVATAVALLFIPINLIVAFFFGCTAMLAASH